MDDICKNPGRNDYWTCPRCHAALDYLEGFRQGEATCPNCAVELDLSVEHEPVAVARILDGEDVE